MCGSIERAFGHNDLGAQTLLIIGNGFDLDLGLKTRYSDFAKSDYWPFKHRLFGLGGYLNLHKDKDNWFDLETSMAKYCENPYPLLPLCLHVFREKNDEKDDKALVQSLNDYLIYESERVHRENLYKNDSVAASLVKAVCTTMICGKIYSFNYTDLNLVSNVISGAACSPVYVHGKISERSIILGINDRPHIEESYRRYFKSRRQSYVSTNIFESLEDYNNIVFHGLSFGDIDNCYFESFFRKIANKQLNDKYIRIITRDNNSRQEVFDNLHKITGRDLSLDTGSDFAVLTSDGSMSEGINALLLRLNPEESL